MFISNNVCFSFSDESDASNGYGAKKKKVIKKKRSDKRWRIPCPSKEALLSHDSSLRQNVSKTHVDKILSADQLKREAVSPGLSFNTGVQNVISVKNDIYSSEDSSFSCDDIVVDRLKDLMEGPDSFFPSSSSTSSCRNITPDLLVQSVASFSISDGNKLQKPTALTDCWKTVGE